MQQSCQVLPEGDSQRGRSTMLQAHALLSFLPQEKRGCWGIAIPGAAGALCVWHRVVTVRGCTDRNPPWQPLSLGVRQRLTVGWTLSLGAFPGARLFLPLVPIPSRALWGWWALPEGPLVKGVLLLMHFSTFLGRTLLQLRQFWVRPWERQNLHLPGLPQLLYCQCFAASSTVCESHGGAWSGKSSQKSGCSLCSLPGSSDSVDELAVEHSDKFISSRTESL